LSTTDQALPQAVQAAGRAVDQIERTLAGLERLGKRFPASTLRLQLVQGFGFHDAAAIVPILSGLGVDTAYLSPITQAAPGSTSGYDVVDYSKLNAELGGDAGFEALVRALDAAGIGLLVDVVPNHMGGVPFDNPHWREVLEWGRSAPSAGMFDIDWDAPGLDGKILTPELGDTLDETVAAGQLRVELDQGRLILRLYGEHVLPLTPPSWELVLGPAAERLDRARALLDRAVADPDWLDGTEGDAAELRNWLSPAGIDPGDPAALAQAEAEHVAARDALGQVASGLGDPVETVASAARLAELEASDRWVAAALRAELEAMREPGRLLAMLDRQHYLLDEWHRSFEDLDYRRFFDIRDLAGVRQEAPGTLEATHTRVIQAALRRGARGGLRIDHPGGLADPAGYLTRLQSAWLKAWARSIAEPGPDRAAFDAEVRRLAMERGLDRPLYLLVESVLGLAENEELPADWPVAGDVGYGPLNLLTWLQLDPEGARRLREEVWPGFAGPRPDLDELAYTSKRGVADGYTLTDGQEVPGALHPDAELLARRLSGLAAGEAPELTTDDLSEAVREIAARLPVYRTYVRRDGGLPPDQRAFVEHALAQAHDTPAVRWLGSVLLRPDPSPEELGIRRRFEQFTSPLMAKGLEDRLLYLYHPDPAANEVGGEPATTGIAPDGWHDRIERLLAGWPHGLHPTSTHDTKRAADVRARLAVLTERPDAWAGFLNDARDLLAPVREQVDGRPAPTDNELYLLLATMAGTLPADELHRSGPAPAEWVERIAGYMEKALKEGKETTSWVTEDRGVAAAANALIGHAGADERFMTTLRRFVDDEIAVPGMVNGLAALVLKTAVLVPDIYQRELDWDLDLVDPDNRRPVEWDRIGRAVDGLRSHLAETAGGHAVIAAPDAAGYAGELLGRWTDGRIKLWVTMLALHTRRRHRRLYARGAYVRVGPGDAGARTVAVARVLGREAVLHLAPRLTTGLAGTSQPPVGEVWGDRVLPIPAGLPGGAWTNVLTGATVRLTPGGDAPLAELLADLPVAILERTGDRDG
jgi:(1->4)-alpha-D-glucan 1-alpha-D-glucosylmutase